MTFETLFFQLAVLCPCYSTDYVSCDPLFCPVVLLHSAFCTLLLWWNRISVIHAKRLLVCYYLVFICNFSKKMLMCNINFWVQGLPWNLVREESISEKKWLLIFGGNQLFRWTFGWSFACTMLARKRKNARMSSNLKHFDCNTHYMVLCVVSNLLKEVFHTIEAYGAVRYLCCTLRCLQ